MKPLKLTPRNCSTCTRSWWSGPERWDEIQRHHMGVDGRQIHLYVEPRILHCGAGVDDGALQDGVMGKNPIWAERKYGRDRIMRLLAGDATEPEGSDCENMYPTDGETCSVWERK